MLLLADRGFWGHALRGACSATGADLLWRVKSDIRLPVRQSLPDGWLGESGMLMAYESREKVFDSANAWVAAVLASTFDGDSTGRTSIVISPHMLRHSFALHMLVALHHALDRWFGLTPEEPKHLRQGPGAAPAAELAQVQGVCLTGQATVAGQEPGEREPLGISEHRLDGDEGS